METKDVFISYKAEEFEEADWVRRTLEQNGISCWMAPACIMGGSSYAEEIPRAIRECAVFVLLLSEKSQCSKWVPRELDQAINESKIVMPFMLENCALKDAFNFYLTNVQRYEAYAGRSAAMEKMIREIRALTGAGEEELQVDEEPDEDPEAETEDAKIVPMPVRKKKKRSRTRRLRHLLPAAGICLLLIILCMKVIPGMMAVKIDGESFSRKETYLSLSEKVLSEKDLSAIAGLRGLRTIILSDCTINGGDLSSLMNENLQRLELEDCGLTEEQLSSLDLSGTSLTHVNLSGNEALTSLEFFQPAADTLIRLDVSRTGIRDLSLLEGFTGLVDFRAEDDQIRQMPSLENFTNLEILCLDGNQLTDLSFLEGCTSLKALTVNGNQLSSLDGLETCIYLEEVQAGSNQLVDLAGLDNTTLLKFVFLNDNQLTDLSVLEHSAASMEKLYIRNNQIEELDFLSMCLGLQYVNMDHNQVETLESLQNCQALKGLSASGNQIRTTKGIEDLKELAYVDLSGNELTEVGVEKPLFAGNEERLILDVSGNRLSSLNIDTDVKYSALYVYGNPLKEYGRLLAAETSCLVMDFDEGMDFKTLGEGEHYDVQILGCPLNWQVGVKDILGHRVSFVEAEEVTDILEKSYSREYIKGVDAYY